MDQYFTIVAGNYLAQALTLGESLSRSTPSASLDVWLLDDIPTPPAPNAGRIVFRRLRDAIPDRELLALFLRYTILEFATAVKPSLFKYYLSADNAPATCIYLDPDIYVFSPLTELFSSKHEGTFGYLTPHLLSPIPRDGEHPSDLDILKSGSYNLGFLALHPSPKTTDFLSWWEQWLKTDCYSDPRTGVFTDQKWIDLASAMWDGFQCLRSPGLNVAYWNLHERQIQIANGNFFINSSGDLYFFHFSGFSPGQRDKLSKHETRIGSKGKPALIALLHFYASRLLENGYAYWAGKRFQPYLLPKGITPDPVSREAFRLFVNTHSKGASPDPSVFLDFLMAPASGSTHSNYVTTLLRLRHDVATAYPNHETEDKERLREWIRNSGIPEMGLDRTILSALSLVPRAHVNYVGYISAVSGVGEAARGNLRALAAANVSFDTIDLSHKTVFPRLAQTQIPVSPPPSGITKPINIIHINADQIRETSSEFVHRVPQNAYNIGYWVWESAAFPQHLLDRFELLDEIWTATDFMAESLRAVSPVPVSVIPHLVEIHRPTASPISRERILRKVGARDDRFTFLVIFDCHSVVARKNPHDAVRAFRETFKPGEAQLIVKTTNASAHANEMEAVKELANGRSDIVFFDAYLDRDDTLDLISAAQVFLSPHRLEGFGLALAESMALGTPVIATGYGGNIDFMDTDSAILLPFDLERLDRDYGAYRAGSHWANPDVAKLCAAMRLLYSQPDRRKALSVAGQLAVGAKLSSSAVANRMWARLTRVINSRAPAPTADAAPPSVQLPLATKSPGQLSSEGLIRALYLTILEREPDPEGLSHYRDILTRHGPARVARDIERSREARAKRPSGAH